MKSMTCKQLGGPCDSALEGESADDVIKAQDQHLKAAVNGGDDSHDEAMSAMNGRWQDPVKAMEWYLRVKKDFAALP